MNKIFSFDAETDGLWGQAFAIGALVYDEQGAEIARFVGRLSDTAVTNDWVKGNVLPTLSSVPVTHESYEIDPTPKFHTPFSNKNIHYYTCI